MYSICRIICSEDFKEQNRCLLVDLYSHLPTFCDPLTSFFCFYSCAIIRNRFLVLDWIILHLHPLWFRVLSLWSYWTFPLYFSLPPTLPGLTFISFPTVEKSNWIGRKLSNLCISFLDSFSQKIPCEKVNRHFPGTPLLHPSPFCNFKMSFVY